ncbi:MAG TPA: FxsA family protein [Solirubrobacteraceae bacterium]
MIVLLLMIGWPVAELFVAVQVAGAIGVLLTVILLIAGWPLGAWLVRSEGRAAWRRLRAASATGRSPGREVLDGALILAGGSLFIVPGFISDCLGLLLLFGPTRSLARIALARNLQSRLVRRATRFRGPGGVVPGAPGYDVDSTATEIKPAQLPR